MPLRHVVTFTNLLDCFEYPKNPYLNQATQKDIADVFQPKNILKIENFKPTKILWLFLSLEIQKQGGMTSQKHYPDVGSDRSSVWNFCTHFLDVISWRKQ